MLRSLGFLLFLADFEDFASLIMTTIGAGCVRKPHRTAVRAGDQVVARQGIVGAPAVAATFRVFALGMGGHDVLLYTHVGRVKTRPLNIRSGRKIIAESGSDVKRQSL